MTRTRVTIVDYGMGNILSVRRALEYCGASVVQTSDPKSVRGAECLVLPGVGAFQNGMTELQRLGLAAALKDSAENGTPILGICLGMQMLFDESEEFGLTAGLGIIPGRVVAIPAINPSGESQKIPHIGWSRLVKSIDNGTDSFNTLDSLGSDDYVYFIHSYMARLSESTHLLASTCYGEIDIPAVVRRGHVLGCQFHPEKSGEVGLNIIKNFLNL